MLSITPASYFDKFVYQGSNSSKQYLGKYSPPLLNRSGEFPP